MKVWTSIGGWGIVSSPLSEVSEQKLIQLRPASKIERSITNCINTYHSIKIFWDSSWIFDLWNSLGIVQKAKMMFVRVLWYYDSGAV